MKTLPRAWQGPLVLGCWLMLAGNLCGADLSSMNVQELEQEALGGNQAARTEIAQRLMGSQKTDPDEVFRLSRIAAMEGNPHGKYLLGECYVQGIGTTRNERLAFQLFTEAAQKQYPPAINSIGHCYLNGTGVEVNYLRAYKFFMQAAALDNRDAKVNLGFLFEHGLGVKQDRDTAIYWYKQAAAEGSHGASAALKSIRAKISPPQDTGWSFSHLFQIGLRPATPAPAPSPVSEPPPADNEPLPAPAETTTPAEAEKKVTETGPASASPESSPIQPSGDADTQPAGHAPGTPVPAATPGTASPLAALRDGIIILCALLLTGLLGAWLLAMLRRSDASHRETNPGDDPFFDPHHDSDNGFPVGEGPRVRQRRLVFSCVDCGQQLLIPIYSTRKLLECPSCHAQYTVWKDHDGVVHLENHHSDGQRKTYISFGKKATTFSPYEVLNLRPGCTLSEIRAAYRARMREYHPDKVATLGKDLRDLAELKAKEVNDAYHSLLKQHASLPTISPPKGDRP